jgi:hypothetical protein
MALDSRLLDDAESLQTWTVRNVDQAHGRVMLTKERATTGDKPIPISRYYGTTPGTREQPA